MRSQVAAPSRLNLYVPHPESRLCGALARGSAIVGLPLSTGLIRIYYEGNVIGAQNLKRYRDKAIQAAGRMLHATLCNTRALARRDGCEFGSRRERTGYSIRVRKPGSLRQAMLASPNSITARARAASPWAVRRPASPR